METNKMVDELLEKAVSAVSEIKTSERWIEYLRVMSKFTSYSINNCMLIAAQCPTASRVAGFRTWQREFNRHVRKGEEAIRILAPITKKVVKVRPDGTEEEKRVLLGFKAVSVFDISQTDGEELPAICKPLEGSVDGYEKIMSALCQVSESRGCQVVFSDFAGQADGFYNRTASLIVIREGMSEQMSLSTLIHELAHSRMHRDSRSSTDERTREVEAESVTFVVADYLGVDMSSYSFDYIASWCASRDAAELESSLKAIKAESASIIKELDGFLGKGKLGKAA